MVKRKMNKRFRKEGAQSADEGRGV
jgi:hypothetical protein